MVLKSRLFKFFEAQCYLLYTEMKTAFDPISNPRAILLLFDLKVPKLDF